MPVFVIADIKITDPSWVSDYAAQVHQIVHRHGGRYLTRTQNIQTLEGEPMDTTLVALIEFPNQQALHAFATDPDYSPHANARSKGSVSRLHVLPAEDVAGTIEYLPHPQSPEPA